MSIRNYAVTSGGCSAVMINADSVVAEKVWLNG
jgi:hypothetical protein